MANRTGYTGLQIGIHWIMALLIAGAFFTHENMGAALRQKIEAGIVGPGTPTPHTILGMLALLFVIWRIVVRLRNGAPEPHGSHAVVAAAKWGHRLLYLLMVAVPVGGFVAWFFGLRDVGEIHELAGKALVILALGHAAAAVWHHVAQKDGTLRRMTRPE
ncbi:cytochrome b [Silicimonas sp. MF1-12-2]|uniref:cytochrome b n=1 Tax=Silicimonas sp. MF1-12-2 TaxID=3384793 RepID=UPI0039B52DD6